MKTIYKKISVLLVAALVLLYLLFPLASVSVFAAEAGSDVMKDLQTDKDFNANQYPQDTNDYSLHVIQIAESKSDELLIYVYQPSSERSGIYASSINIAREKTNSASLSFQNYPLTFCNASGVFFKYKVKGFTLQKTEIRYYNISNILRPFSKALGDKIENDNKAKDVPYAVGQLWTAKTVNGNVTYDMKGTEVITITDKYVGFQRYLEGVKFSWKTTQTSTDSHFVAFSTDKPMDRLLTASVEYTTQLMEAKFCTSKTEHLGTVAHKYHEIFDKKEVGEPVRVPELKLTYDQEAGTANGKYVWNRIERTEDFLKSIDPESYELTKNGSDSIESTQWVLRFCETEYYSKGEGLGGEDIVWGLVTGGIYLLVGEDPSIRYTKVSDVMILQLGFETDGVYYNLGAVDNHQTGSDFSITSFFKKGEKNWWKILAAILGGSVLFGALCLFIYGFINRHKTVIKFSDGDVPPKPKRKPSKNSKK